MILVTGAAGKTGKAVVKALAGRGALVRALTRRPEQADALMALGAAAVCVGNFEDRDALAQAAGGVEAIYHICPNVSRNEVAYARAVADEAKRQRVARFVYHSVLHPQIETMPHHWAKLRVERCCSAAALCSPSCSRRPICKISSAPGAALSRTACSAFPIRPRRG
jgi:uncharacterized protein YbjT (DUF2867 family)